MFSTRPRPSATVTRRPLALTLGVALAGGVLVTAPDRAVALDEGAPPPCENNLEIPAGSELACVLVPPGDAYASADGTWGVDGAPTGLRAQDRSGYLRWTPWPDQVGEHEMTVTYPSGKTKTLKLKVRTSDHAMPDGIYVAPGGADSGKGTPDEPLGDIQKAVGKAEPGDTIYVRGGTYTNPEYGQPFDGTRDNNFIRINGKNGTFTKPFALRNWGNEYATLKSDVNGIFVRQSQHWTIQGLELEGTAADLSIDEALETWWNGKALSTPVGARGLAMNGSRRITVRDMVVHHFPGAGVSNNGGTYVFSEDNLVYDNAWYSTAGTHGFSNSKPASEEGDNPDTFGIRMTGNFVFGNQSSNISHVFRKGFVTMEIDEGNGLHMQNNARTFIGRFLAEDNVAVLNGKAGLGLNTVDGSVIRNNSFFHNTQAVPANGELSLQSSVSDSITHNLFHATDGHLTLQSFDDPATGVEDNYAVRVPGDELPDGITAVDSVFVDPENGDFRPAEGIPSGYGASEETLDRIAGWVAEYGLVVDAAPDVVTDDYKDMITERVIATWPAPGSEEAAELGVPADLVLRVPGDDEDITCYDYSTRDLYPGDSPTECPVPDNGPDDDEE
ncbi:right-handed parallel beta-helix repeat-containing protein [Phycicoccus sp. BSK3Z-2]|uniref:Right-handed parallel beta-helix repeat-containing protein n=1 Tax=Phycicoccus avicenniae TaxID=2828860 RepID=A0A941DA63_9MICO|nr:right-handed parallel beta-helix repeat-containing protein [Phycicoccus avicenniae]MBR7742677.1 right-handed parallel beta-helix repeat-containing protein [Phycicoccus avicenniae]